MTINSTSNPAQQQLLARKRSPIFLESSQKIFWVGLTTVALSLISALLTFLILTGLTPLVPRNEVVVGALLVNLLFIVILLVLVAYQVRGLVQAWQEKLAGARLHARIVALFSVIAVLPTILLAIGATVSFSRSLDSWFSGRVRSIIDNSVNVAQTYIEEHGRLIRTDVVNMARDLDSASPDIQNDDALFKKQVIAQAGLREIPSAYVIDASGRPLIKAIEAKRIPFTTPTPLAITEAEQGQIPLSMSRQHNRLSAIAKLASRPGQYLYVNRPVSPVVIRHLLLTQKNAAEYTRTRRARGGLKWAHALMYFTISMTALLAAIWSGMWFAGRFVAPISRLITAAQQVSKGDLHVALPERRGEGDLRRLSQNFNTMTRELRHQRHALLAANTQLIERRRFTEAVLSGVSAGILGLDSQDRITLVSRSAEELLNVKADDLIGMRLVEAIPEFADVFEKYSSPKLKPRAQQQITMGSEGEERTLAIQVTHEAAGQGDVGSVVTFDDVTELVSAQRTNAWADVARRIAHEIKNPLTPIILSVGRLRKNYGHLITEKKELFENLTATIERQAGDIKTMVDEFAAFARMPEPQMITDDLRDAVREPVILFRESNPQIDYEINIPDEPVLCSIDRRLITQATTNLIKNATEAIQGIGQDAEAQKEKGHITTSILLEGERVLIEVADNGPGLPKQNRSRITEPYVTTKGHKGTGLGLAMVNKIAEQHGGTLILEDAKGTKGELKKGAVVKIVLPLLQSIKNTDASQKDDSQADDTPDTTNKTQAVEPPKATPNVPPGALTEV